MTVAEALELIHTSSPWQTAKGDARVAWRLWKGANPGEAGKLLRYMAGVDAARPTLQTKYGRGMAELASRKMWAFVPAFFSTAPTPEPPPPPPPTTMWSQAEAIAAPGGFGSLRWRELHAAGFRRFSCTLSDGDPMLASNLQEFPAIQNGIQQLGGLVGGLFIMAGADVAGQTTKALARAEALDLDYLLFDVEDYKADTPDGRPAADRFVDLVSIMRLHPEWNARSSFITYGDTGGDTPLCSPMADGKPVVDFSPASGAGWHGFFEAYSETGAPRFVDQAVKLATMCFDKNRTHVSIGSQDVAAQAASVLANVKAGRCAAGFSVWDAPNLSDGEIAALRDVILAGAAVT